ncbi:glycosyltransferase family 1 protein, partial [Thioclava sp. BHET1]
MTHPAIAQIEVIAPNLKRRLSGVTTTVLRLIPIQSREIGIVATGPGLPPEIPHLPLSRVALLPGDRWRVWHARRNNEMVLGLILRHLLRRRFRLLFTSAAQRDHKPFTKWLIRQQDAVVATTPQAAAFLERPAQVIMHGVDTRIFHP